MRIKVTFVCGKDKWEMVFESWAAITRFLSGRKRYRCAGIELLEDKPKKSVTAETISREKA